MKSAGEKKAETPTLSRKKTSFQGKSSLSASRKSSFLSRLLQKSKEYYLHSQYFQIPKGEIPNPFESALNVSLMLCQATKSNRGTDRFRNHNIVEAGLGVYKSSMTHVKACILQKSDTEKSRSPGSAVIIKGRERKGGGSGGVGCSPSPSCIKLDKC